MLPRPQTLRCFLIFSVCLAMACGCGGGNTKRPPMGKVSGKVLYKGNPVPNVDVSFMTEGAARTAAGTTNANGEFQLTTYDTNDGAVIGTHKVTVTPPPAAPTGPMSASDLATKGAPPAPKGVTIPPKFADPKTTPLKNTVDAGKNDITIELID